VHAPLKSFFVYQFPTITDLNNDAVTLTVFIKDSNPKSLPGFINLVSANNSLTIYCTNMIEVMTYNLIANIADPNGGSNEYPF
jgi:hypothetical protein